ncbi:MAG: hypothetical protein GXP54_07015, partial [Deltaproteobacteria bacterium]|nr:hypothetical protein [Deltaproteobacteria bacterium]
MLTLCAITAAATSCNGTTTYETLYINVTSSTEIQADHLSLWVVKDVDGLTVVTPRDPDDLPGYSFDVFGMDLSTTPFTIQLKPGDRFNGT